MSVSIGNGIGITDLTWQFGLTPLAKALKYSPLTAAYLTKKATLPNDIVGTGDVRPVQQGRCYNFDGTDDYINLGNDNVFDLDTEFTFSFWLKPDNLSSYQQIISKFGSAGNYSYQVNITNTGGLRIDLSNNGTANGVTIFSSPGLVVGTWTHVAITYNSGSLKLYVNNTSAITGSNTVSLIYAGNTSLNIGRDPSGIQYLDAGLFDFRIFNTELSSTDISDIYNHQTVQLSSLVAHYKMDEQAGSIAYDSSGNNNHGTITNATLSTFHAIDNDIYSFQNEVGHSETSGSTPYIPRDESNTSQDILGNTLQYTGKAPLNAELVSSHCATFDGVDDQFTSPLYWNDFSCELLIKTPLNTNAVNHIYTARGPNAQSRFTFSTDNTGYMGIQQEYQNAHYYRSLSYQTNTWYKVFWNAKDGIINLWVDDIEINDSSTRNLGLYSSLNNVAVFSGWNNSSLKNPFSGQIAYAKFWDGIKNPDTSDLPHDFIIWTSGQGNIAYNVIPGRDHSTGTNTTDSSLWANTQDEFHYNITNGFSACATFDGNNDVIDLPDIGELGENDFEISVSIKQPDLGGQSAYIIYNKEDFDGNFVKCMFDTDGTLRMYVEAVDGTNHSFKTTNTYDDDQWHDVIFSREGSTISIDVDNGSETVTSTFTGNWGASDQEWRVGYPRFSGSMKDLKIVSNGNTIAHYKMDEGSGTNIADSSGNNQDGTANNITESSFWGHKIPALLSGTNAVDGNTITNPAGYYHNGAETKLKFPLCPELKAIDDKLTTDFMFDSSLSYDPNEIAHTDIVANKNDIIFADITDSKAIKNLLMYSSALTGTELTTVKKAVNIS